MEPEGRTSSALMVATCRTLGALVQAAAAAEGEEEIVAVLDEVVSLLLGPDVRRDLEAVRRAIEPIARDDLNADIVDVIDALLVLEPHIKARHSLRVERSEEE